MRTLDLAESSPTLEELLAWAQDETVIVRTRAGAEFVVAGVGDFEFDREVESLRNNEEFMAFLDARAEEPTVSLEEARRRTLGS